MLKFFRKVCIMLAMSIGLCMTGCNGGAETSVSESSSPEATEKVRSVGITYSTWFPPLTGEKWGTPVLGNYYSADEDVLNQHAEWIAGAGVDFIVIDWTNGIDYVKGVQDGNHQYIEAATDELFRVFRERVDAGKPTPKIIIATGIDTADKAQAFVDGRMDRKVNQIWEDYYGNPKYADLIFQYNDKPLIMMYLATSACVAKEGSQIYQDDRLTIRFFTGFLGEQQNLLKPGTRISKYGYWSWWERGNNSYAVKADGTTECITISAAWVGSNPDAETALNNPNAAWLPENGAVGRRGGQTFREQWDMAIDLDPDIVLIQSFNEWISETMPNKAAEELDPEYSNDIEPSVELGTLYLDILREKSEEFKKQ